jgi:hypothetical protein
MSPLWPKADIRSTQLMSFSGVKRTCLFAAQMSAFDPKRTLLAIKCEFDLRSQYASLESWGLEEARETARVPHASRRRGGV